MREDSTTSTLEESTAQIARAIQAAGMTVAEAFKVVEVFRKTLAKIHKQIKPLREKPPFRAPIPRSKVKESIQGSYIADQRSRILGHSRRFFPGPFFSTPKARLLRIQEGG